MGDGGVLWVLGCVGLGVLDVVERKARDMLRRGGHVIRWWEEGTSLEGFRLFACSCKAARPGQRTSVQDLGCN